MKLWVIFLKQKKEQARVNLQILDRKRLPFALEEFVRYIFEVA